MERERTETKADTDTDTDTDKHEQTSGDEAVSVVGIISRVFCFPIGTWNRKQDVSLWSVEHRL